MKKEAFENLSISQKSDVAYIINKAVDEMVAWGFDFMRMRAAIEYMNERIGCLAVVPYGRFAKENGSVETNPQRETLTTDPPTAGEEVSEPTQPTD
jgi:hypothetical protein